MKKPSKTEQVVCAMVQRETVTIGHIRQVTGLSANEIGGILASLERQERVARVEIEGATRNHWRLLKAEKRSRSLSSGPSLCERRRLAEQARMEAASSVAVELQNIFHAISRRTREVSAHYAH